MSIKVHYGGCKTNLQEIDTLAEIFDKSLNYLVSNLKSLPWRTCHSIDKARRC